MQELLRGAAAVCGYLAIAASTLLICRRLIRIPDELFRKMLHFVLLFSYIPFVFAFDRWWVSAGFAVGLEILIFPALAWAEKRFAHFSAFVTERSTGEFKRSLLLAFSMLAACIAVCWGWLGDRFLVLACMYAWGVGDAFAALIGKAYGRHKIRLSGRNCRKSVEGSAAMLITSALTVFAVLMLRGGMTAGSCAAIALAGAAAATLTELVTPNGMDTVTCPTCAMLVILPLTALLGGLA